MACVGALARKPSWPVRCAAIFAPLSRNTPSVLVALFGISLSAMAFNESRKSYLHEAESAFHAYAAERTLILQNAVDESLLILQSLTALYRVSEQVNREEFGFFADHLNPHAHGIRALEWIPRIPRSERPLYERRAEADGFSGFRIVEPGPDGGMIPAGERDEYFPVYFIEPLAGNQVALGLDLAWNPSRLQALQTARDQGDIAVTEMVQLVQETGSSLGFLAFSPLYRTGSVPERLEDRRSELSGFVLGVYSISEIVTATLEEIGASVPLDIYLFDEGAGPDPELLYFHPFGFADRPSEGPAEEDFDGRPEHSERIIVGDREWSLVLVAPPGFEGGLYHLQPWAVLAIGMLLTLLLAQHLFMSGNRTAAVEALVASRTADLTEANDQLSQEIEERSRVEAELARSNAELEQFASIASHDLQEPLRKVQAFGDRLQKRCEGQLDEKGRDYLSRMGNATARMQTLINDLLSLSRVTRADQRFMPTDLATVVRDVLADVEMPIKETGAEVIVGQLPEVFADPTQMRQLFQNLIGNSLKYRRADAAPTIHIDAARADAGSQGPPSDRVPVWRIRFRDNGIGFGQHQAERIFGMFQRLHGRDAYSGSGIGLAVCRRIVERHGGVIRAEGQPGQGATIIVSLPGKSNQHGAFPT